MASVLRQEAGTAGHCRALFFRRGERLSSSEPVSGAPSTAGSSLRLAGQPLTLPPSSRALEQGVFSGGPGPAAATAAGHWAGGGVLGSGCPLPPSGSASEDRCASLCKPGSGGRARRPPRSPCRAPLSSSCLLAGLESMGQSPSRVGGQSLVCKVLQGVCAAGVGPARPLESAGSRPPQQAGLPSWRCSKTRRPLWEKCCAAPPRESSSTRSPSSMAVPSSQCPRLAAHSPSAPRGGSGQARFMGCRPGALGSGGGGHPAGGEKMETWYTFWHVLSGGLQPIRTPRRRCQGWGSASSSSSSSSWHGPEPRSWGGAASAWR